MFVLFLESVWRRPVPGFFDNGREAEARRAISETEAGTARLASLQQALNEAHKRQEELDQEVVRAHQQAACLRLTVCHFSLTRIRTLPADVAPVLSASVVCARNIQLSETN